jgi:hypothetical protein
MNTEPKRVRLIISTAVCGLAMAGVLGLAACAKPNEATAENFTAAMNTYLAQRGELCVGKSQWPIDVNEREIRSNARNAVQMPVLEKLGLVAMSVAEVDLKDDEGVSHLVKVRRYALTDEGRKYYVARGREQAGGKAPPSDFCAAKLSLDKVVGWTAPVNPQAGGQMVVSYTYRAEPAPWMQDPEAQRVFPVVANVLRGAGSAQLTETFRQTDAGWVAADM